MGAIWLQAVGEAHDEISQGHAAGDHFAAMWFTQLIITTHYTIIATYAHFFSSVQS